MRVVIIGGTGYLGYFISSELLARDHEVIAIGLNSPQEGSMPSNVEIEIFNADIASEDHLAKVLTDADVLIHAAGVDGRFSSSIPAIDGFRKSNVEPFHRILPAMKRAGTRRLVILGSYYTALQRIYPTFPIVARSAYPISRLEQAECAFKLAGSSIDVAILELPYIFGSAPLRGSLWGYLIDEIKNAQGPIPVAVGGTACVTAKQVGQAAAMAAMKCEGHKHYPIGCVNLSHREIYSRFASALGISPEFINLDPSVAIQRAEAQKRKLISAGIETGYDPVDLAFLQSQDLYLDPLPSMEMLGYGFDDVDVAIKETVFATQQYGGAGPAANKMENK